MAMIIPFSKAAQKTWSQSEQSEFFRAVHILRTTGLPVVTESGLSDEGDPWTVFLREDTGDVVVHICRIEGQVIAASAASPDIVSGSSFRAVIDRILKSQPLVLPTTQSTGTLFLHPSAVIIAFIATAFSWSYSEEASLKQYSWNTDKDGLLEPVPQSIRPGSSKSILAEAITSKAEATSTADSFSAFSERLAIAASIAAVALAADLVTKSAPNAPWQELMAHSSELASSQNSASRAGTTAGPDVPLFLSDDNVYEHATNSDPSSDTAATTGASELAFAPWKHQRDYSSASHGLLELPASPLSSDAAESSTLHAFDYSKLPFAVEPPTFAKPNNETPAPEVHARASSGDPTHPSALAATQPSSNHDIVTADASDFLSYLLFQKVGVAHPSLQDLSMAVTVLTADHLKQLDGDGAPSNLSDHRAPLYNDGGFKLVEDILNFAFDRSKELSTSLSDWMSFSRGLKSNAFLPDADRVLIIDIPDLRADAFKFADGLLMVSHEFAAQYLPGVSLTTQSELGVSDGITLKLIGVIDMTPTLHS